MLSGLCKKRSSKSRGQVKSNGNKSNGTEEAKKPQIDQKLEVSNADTNNNQSMNVEINLEECDGKENDQKKEENELYAGINPDPNKVETTMMLSKRTNKMVHHVVHNVNWSGIFDETLVPNITKWKFKPKAKNKVEKGKDAWTIEIFSPSESKKLIELCEIYGFEDCGYPPEYRSNTRMITNDSALAQKLYERIKACCPKTYKVDGVTWTICGLNGTYACCICFET